MSELRRRNVRILIDVMAGAPGSGVEKGAFIAVQTVLPAATDQVCR
jgi:hypothetical protein